NISPWSRAMSAITGCRLMAPNYGGKLWNGRQRAAHARAAWPGNTFRISPDGWGCVYRRMDNRGQMSERTFRHPSSKSGSAQILRWVDRGRALTDFEMQLRRGDAAGLTGMRDHLATLHGLAALDQNVAGVRIGRDETIGVAHQHQVAVALELTAGIGDDAVFRGLDRRALRHGEIDAVILHTIRLGPERRDHAATHRPAESRQTAGRLRALYGILTGHCRSVFHDACRLRRLRHGELGRWRGSRRFVPHRRRRRLFDIGDRDALAGLELGIHCQVVGPGDHRNRLVVDACDA